MTMRPSMAQSARPGRLPFVNSTPAASRVKTQSAGGRFAQLAAIRRGLADQVKSTLKLPFKTGPMNWR